MFGDQLFGVFPSQFLNRSIQQFGCQRLWLSQRIETDISYLTLNFSGGLSTRGRQLEQIISCTHLSLEIPSK